MYYRRRLLLALLQALGGRAEKMRLHKLLLVLMAARGEAAYHFVPYRYGAFSFQANADLVALTTRGLLANHEREWELLDEEDHRATLKTADQEVLTQATQAFGASYSVTTGDDGVIEVSHSPFMYLVDEHADIVLTWPFGLPSDAIAIDLDIMLDTIDGKA